MKTLPNKTRVQPMYIIDVKELDEKFPQSWPDYKVQTDDILQKKSIFCHESYIASRHSVLLLKFAIHAQFNCYLVKVWSG